MGYITFGIRARLYRLPHVTVVTSDPEIILEPEEIIDTRIRQLRNRSISEYLIKWKNLPAEDSTWEDASFIQKHPELLKC